MSVHVPLVATVPNANVRRLVAKPLVRSESSTHPIWTYKLKKGACVIKL